MFFVYIFRRKILYVAFFRYNIAEFRIFGIKYVYIPNIVIDKLRIEKNFSYGDIAKIIRNVPDGMTADDIINLFV